MSIRKIEKLSKLSNRTNSIQIKANDEIFQNISEASKLFGVSPSTIRSRLNNPKYSNWSYINKERQVATNLARGVVIEDKYYLSVSMAAAAEGISEKTLRKYIKLKPNWNFFDMFTDKQKKEILQLNESIRTSNAGGYKLGWSV
uniref:Putative site-specific DNA endonuclease n=1 Tax=Hazenia capsulata TaxID=2202518 RepID=A0A1W6EHN1_9CHLO|nr:putative site-specific DNA endonuclease [Hazenia capsulata]ARK14901.1 putative site-specific DNA endonuclease [Hazenia capsulata]